RTAGLSLDLRCRRAAVHLSHLRPPPGDFTSESPQNFPRIVFASPLTFLHPFSEAPKLSRWAAIRDCTSWTGRPTFTASLARPTFKRVALAFFSDLLVRDALRPVLFAPRLPAIHPQPISRSRVADQYPIAFAPNNAPGL